MSRKTTLSRWDPDGNADVARKPTGRSTAQICHPRAVRFRGRGRADHLDIPEQGLDPRPVRAATSNRSRDRSTALLSECSRHSAEHWIDFGNDRGPEFRFLGGALRRQAQRGWDRGTAGAAPGVGRSRVPAIPYATSRDDSKWRRAHLRWTHHEHQPERCVHESGFTSPRRERHRS